MNDIEEVEKIAEKIHGWMQPVEGKELYNLAKNCTKGVIVEIGSFKGKSTVWLARGSKAGNKLPVYAVDPFDPIPFGKKERINVFPEFLKNIKEAGVEELVIPQVMKSEEFAKDFLKEIALIFIDGSHRFKEVDKDSRLWFPYVMPGGRMAFHDFGIWKGPTNVAAQFFKDTNVFRDVRRMRSLIHAKKFLYDG